MGKIVSKGGQPKEMTEEEINAAVRDAVEADDYDALYDVISGPIIKDDNWYEDWCITGLSRGLLTWHFEEPVDPVMGDATMDLMDQFVNVYTGTRWVRIAFIELLHL